MISKSGLATSPVDVGVSARRMRAGLGDGTLYLMLGAAVALAWQLSRRGLYTAGSDLGYGLGVGGGLMMLALFAYPLRKHLRFMQHWGRLKVWFVFHMACGVGGPLLILLHCAFRIGSLNAAVALTSMLIVAASGIVGRFIYGHIHRGMLGEKSSLRELQAAAGFQHDAVKSRFHSVPAVEQRLFAFEAEALRGDAGWREQARRIVVLPYRQWLTWHACGRDLDRALARFAAERGWSRRDLDERRRRARRLLRAYLGSVVRVAQFTAYERLFSLWHVLHVPFVYVMLVTAVVHVVAVHAY
jgi:hypothetical protein